MRILLIILLAAFTYGCTVEPEPLAYGTDMCHTCKMTLMDPKFGAEIVTKKGKVYKFDDVNCMLGFYHSDFEEQGNISHLLVINFAQSNQLIDATNSWYLKSELIRSPMASGIAAFATEEEYSLYKKEWKAILMSWGETNTQFK
jgi:copper chaperone NosL